MNIFIEEFKTRADKTDYRNELFGALLSVCDFLYDNNVLIPNEWEYEHELSSDTNTYWYKCIESYYADVGYVEVIEFGEFLFEEINT